MVGLGESGDKGGRHMEPSVLPTEPALGDSPNFLFFTVLYSPTDV